ncbi:MAG TPA: C45 family autoproteolytic acyltransferase/hydrolase [Kofleriaceae bacterium]|nr:C45 family autoproteolytic acyltransferase/hydrolase [Kofleriaceae bacterium]
MSPLPLLCLRLRGTQEEMGRQHAELLAPRGGFAPLLAFYPELPERIILSTAAEHGDSLPLRAARAVKDRLLDRLARARPPEYLERSRAFLTGLGYPSGWARYLGVMDVLQNLVGVLARLRAGPFGRGLADAMVPACSTLMVWDGASRGGALRHARNFDFPGIGVWDAAPAVVFCTPDRGLRYGFVSARGADTPGVSAFNEAGITVTAHTRFHREVAFHGAAIVDLGHDIARRAETLADAVAIARERPVASTWGLAVSSARERRALVIETTARAVELIEPDGDHLTCANRYRHPRHQAGEVQASAAWAEHSDGRERRLRALVAAARPGGGMDAAALQAALADRTDPDDPQRVRGGGAVVAQACTVQSMVVDAGERAVHVGVGAAPASCGPWARVDWSWDGPVDAWEPVPAAGQGTAATPFAWWVEANRLSRQEYDHAAAVAAVEQAVAGDPADPAYRFAAGLMRLRRGEPAPALAHLEAGLAAERAPYRRGQLLLWASRAADGAGDADRARRLRAELLDGTDARLAEHRSAARAEQRRPFRRRRFDINLALLDAR